MQSKFLLQKQIGLILCITLLLMLSCGCGCGNGADQAAQAGYEVTDSQGTVVKIPHKPQRILTLSMYTDSIALGMVNTDRMAAISDLADDPVSSNIVEKAKKIPAKIKSPSSEEIFALKPDLIIANGWTSGEVINSLRELGLPVIVCKGVNEPADVKECVTLIGQAVGETGKSAKVIAKIEAELADIKAKVAQIPSEKRQKVVLVSLMSSYGGSGCIFDKMCEDAGVINGIAAAGIKNGHNLTKEMLVKINPDILLMPSYHDHGNYDVSKFNQEYLEDPSLQTLKAIQNNQLLYPREGYIYNASQDFVYGVKELAYIAYGEAFAQADDCHISYAQE